MSALVVRCPACGHEETFDGIVPFRAACGRCEADLHVCVACRFHDRFAEGECRETAADPVARKEQRNLCEYFKPRAPGEAPAGASAEAEARRKLEALFGGAPAPAQGSAPAQGPAQAGSPADEARRKLEALFKKKP